MWLFHSPDTVWHPSSATSPGYCSRPVMAFLNFSQSPRCRINSIQLFNCQINFINWTRYMEHFSLNCGLKFTLFRVKNKKFKKNDTRPRSACAWKPLKAAVLPHSSISPFISVKLHKPPQELNMSPRILLLPRSVTVQPRAPWARTKARWGGGLSDCISRQ